MSRNNGTGGDWGATFDSGPDDSFDDSTFDVDVDQPEPQGFQMPEQGNAYNPPPTSQPTYDRYNAARYPPARVPPQRVATRGMGDGSGGGFTGWLSENKKTIFLCGAAALVGVLAWEKGVKKYVGKVKALKSIIDE